MRNRIGCRTAAAFACFAFALGLSAGSLFAQTKIVVPGSAVTASTHDGNVPANTVDGSLNTRWSASGDGQWIKFDLGSNRSVGYVRLAFYNGAARTFTFDVQTSLDNSSWATARSGATSALNNNLQTFDFPDVSSARWVRIVGHQNSQNAWNSYTEVEVWSGGGSGGTVAAPSFNPGGGTYSTGQSVTISTTTSGATIRYTTNGSTPTSTSGTIYSGPVAITSTTTLRAIAYLSGMNDSGVTSATYTINSGSGVFRPFPQHTAYVAGTIKPNNVSQSAMDSAVVSKWNAYKSAYLRSRGDHYYIRYNSAGETVSEAHGYGMLLAAIMAGADANAKSYFDGMYRYYRAHPSSINSDLMAWKQNSSGQNVEGSDSATDGDMDIAYALLLADRQWGSAGAINYRQAAINMINAIMASDVHQGRWYLRLGDWATSGNYANSTRCSDFMLQHMKAYQVATGDTRWSNVISTTYGIINTLYNSYASNTGLMPDFVDYNSGSYRPAPANFLESANDGKYYYNSCRVPWRFATDYVMTGDTRSRAQLQKLNSWIKSKTGSNPANVVAGYNLNGSNLASYNDNSFTIPFGVSAMIDSSNQAWLNSIWSRAASSGNDGYYADSIKLLSMIVMSGNWWAP